MTTIKKLSILVSVVLVVLFLADFSLAQNKLEVPLPSIGDASSITTMPFLPDYINYIFNFAIGIAGLIAFISIVYGGARYLTSAGNPSAMSDANSQIFAGVIGLIILLGSWIILTTINPELVKINPQLEGSGIVVEDSPGVYLCQDNTDESCRVFTDSKDTLGELSNKVQRVKFKNINDIVYGVVLHEDKYHKGNCVVCLSDGCQVEISAIGGDGVSSITVFLRPKQVSGSGVTIYDGEEYQDGKFGHIGPYTSEVWYDDMDDVKEKFSSEASSAKVEGTYMLILYKKTELKGNCLVLQNNDPSLSNEGFSQNTKSFRVLFAQ